MRSLSNHTSRYPLMGTKRHVTGPCTRGTSISPLLSEKMT
nr:MAG TPA: hypothetical protein [Caudoviricetes sp.]